MTEQVRRWVAARREKLADPGAPDGNEAIWGLALSGGGIRSATFCFGLLRALARGKALPRFDLLSTVSGGGYIGGAVGRLFDQAKSREDTRRVYDALRGADDERPDIQGIDNTWFTWWLRANGRYLIPRGFKDSLFAVSHYLQNVLGIHAELGALIALAALAFGIFDIAVWSAIGESERLRGALAALPYAARLVPTAWLWLVPLALCGLMLMCTFWTLPEPGGDRQHRSGVYWLAAAVALVTLLTLRPDLRDGRLFWQWAGALLFATAWCLAIPLGMLMLHRSKRAVQAEAPPDGSTDAANATHIDSLAREEARHRLTAALGRVAALVVAVVVAGALERIAWSVAFEVESLRWLLGALVVAFAALRGALPRLLGTSTTSRPTLGLGLAAMGSAIGYLLAAAVVVVWFAALYRGLFAENAERTFFTREALIAACVLLVGLLTYLWLSRFNFGFLNLSSLHNFYRARITRGFLGAANGARFEHGPSRGGASTSEDALHALDTLPAADRRARKEVTGVLGSDDVPMATYEPHRHGGPVHLVNVCVNETRDRRGGLFNQDRRGVPMVVGPGALASVGSSEWQRIEPDAALTLGRWLAISGGAVAPGLGYLTRGGVATLLTLCGLRLGYWWSSHGLANDTAAPARRMGKSQGLVNELFGRFDAGPGEPWYLSDGGHYENTGALTLLAEEASVIVVADCGADPDNRFTDLENLVRKARIDLQAEIVFTRPRAGACASALEAFGSLDDIASPDSLAYLALARVEYRRSGRAGHLVLVKPTLTAGVSADLVNFKRDNPAFPQEPTTDQFFSEAQWESYYRLGRLLGEPLTLEFLRDIAEIERAMFERDAGVRAASLQGGSAADAAKKRLPARIAGSAVAATIGAGAVATVGVSVWQALDGVRSSWAADAQKDETELKELAERYGDWSAGKHDALGPLAAVVLRAADRCAGTNSEWFRRSQFAQCALKELLEKCPQGSAPSTCDMLRRSNVICLQHRTQNGQLYWGYEFQDTRLAVCPAPDVAAAAPTAPFPTPASAPVGVDTATLPPAVIVSPASAIVAASATAASAVVPALPPSTPTVAVPVPAPAPAPAPAPPPAPASTASAPCAGKTVYVQIFGGEQRDAVRVYRDPWRTLGASVPPIEDVLATARREGRTPPRPDREASRVYAHDEASLPCASELVTRGNAVADKKVLKDLAEPKLLPGRLKRTPGTIEVWIAAPKE